MLEDINLVVTPWSFLTLHQLLHGKGLYFVLSGYSLLAPRLCCLLHHSLLFLPVPYAFQTPFLVLDFHFLPVLVLVVGWDASDSKSGRKPDPRKKVGWGLDLAEKKGKERKMFLTCRQLTKI